MVLSLEEHQTLEGWQRATTIAAGRARRGKIILLLAAGSSQSAVAQAVGVQRTVVLHWPSVFSPSLDGLSDAPAAAPRRFFPPSGDPRRAPGLQRPDLLGRSLSPWDGTELARQLSAAGIVAHISAATVRRMLAAHHLKPWRQHVWLSPKQPRDAAF